MIIDELLVIKVDEVSTYVRVNCNDACDGSVKGGNVRVILNIFLGVRLDRSITGLIEDCDKFIESSSTDHTA